MIKLIGASTGFLVYLRYEFVIIAAGLASFIAVGFLLRGRYKKKLAESEPEFRHDVMRRLWQVVVDLIIIALLLFISAGGLDWPYAWLYMALLSLVDLIGLQFISLELLAERGSKKENIEKWDKVIVALLGLSGFCIYLIAGLDFCWTWTPKFSTALHICSILIFLTGNILQVWAMSANRFFSSAMRIKLNTD